MAVTPSTFDRPGSWKFRVGDLVRDRSGAIPGEWVITRAPSTPRDATTMDLPRYALEPAVSGHFMEGSRLSLPVSAVETHWCRTDEIGVPYVPIWLAGISGDGRRSLDETTVSSARAEAWGGTWQAAYLKKMAVARTLSERSAAMPQPASDPAYWMVTEVDAARVRHASPEAAKGEALRLAAKAPGENFAVLQSIGSVRVPLAEPVVTPHAPAVDADDERPF
mgnify:CR=1 FL=1